jgi:hypothetical protein
MMCHRYLTLGALATSLPLRHRSNKIHHHDIIIMVEKSMEMNMDRATKHVSRTHAASSPLQQLVLFRIGISMH